MIQEIYIGTRSAIAKNINAFWIERSLYEFYMIAVNFDRIFHWKQNITAGSSSNPTEFKKKGG